MSIKTKVLGAAATLTVACAVTTAGTIPVRAATLQCGPGCIQFYNARLGASFIESVLDGVAQVGQPTILGAASGSNPAETSCQCRATYLTFTPAAWSRQR
jgi:hypothetical protein